MEQKTPNLGSWRRVLQHRFESHHVENDGFRGYVTRFFIDKVSEPRVKHQGKRTWCIADDGFLWLQHFPCGCHYTIRTVFNASRHVEQWYIDICKPFELDDHGVPTYEDWDLDVIVWPDGEIELWDADELEQSLLAGEISREDYETAWSVATRLMEEIRTGRLVMPRLETEFPLCVDLSS